MTGGIGELMNFSLLAHYLIFRNSVMMRFN